MGFKLDRIAFAYGNIKPDFIHTNIKCEHTLDESLYYVNKYSQKLMKHNISIQKFSISLELFAILFATTFAYIIEKVMIKRGF